MVARRPSLLYISPVIPAVTGNGLAMRAGVILEALAAQYAVSLLVVPLYSPPSARVPPFFEGLCRRTIVIAPGSPFPLRLRLLRKLSSFDVVHVFRLAA